MAVGGIWFLANLRHFGEQGFVAIAMPMLIFVLGLVYYRKGSAENE